MNLVINSQYSWAIHNTASLLFHRTAQCPRVNLPEGEVVTVYKPLKHMGLVDVSIHSFLTSGLDELLMMGR